MWNLKVRKPESKSTVSRTKVQDTESKSKGFRIRKYRILIKNVQDPGPGSIYISKKYGIRNSTGSGNKKYRIWDQKVQDQEYKNTGSRIKRTITFNSKKLIKIL